MAKKEKQIDIDRYFTRQMFGRQYFPALISAVVLSFGDIADGLVLGNRIGYVGLAALALTMPVAQIFNVIMNALGIGGSVRFASKMAQGEQEEAVTGFQSTVSAALAAGLVIAVAGNLLLNPMVRFLGAEPGDEVFRAAAGYLRILLIGTPVLFLNYVLNYYLKNDDLEKQASLAFTTGNVFDISLNILLVLVFHLGVYGAALSTITGQAIGAALSIRALVKHDGVLTFQSWKISWREAWLSFQTGLPSSIEFFYSMIFLIIANNLLMQTNGGIGVAILDVVLSVSYFMMNLSDAVAKSAMPVVSTYSGEKNERGMSLALRIGLRYTLISGAFLGVLVAVFPDYVCQLFGMSDMEILTQARTALFLYGISIPLASVNILLINYHEARQQEHETLLLATARGVLPILLSIFFSFAAPQAFWSLFCIAEIFTLAVYVFRKNSSKSGAGSEKIYRRTLLSHNDEISRTTGEIKCFCEKWGTNISQQYMTMMAVEEICVATMNNGFKGEKNGFVQIVLIAEPGGTFELHIRDNAASYNPLAMELGGTLADENVNLDALGIYTIKKRAKQFSYRHFQGFNTVIIRI